MYLNGEVDWAPEVPLAQLESVQLKDDYIVAPYLGVYYYIFQMEKEPLTDERVRKALSMGLDRDTLVKKVTGAGETAAYSMVPPMAGYDPTPGVKGFNRRCSETSCRSRFSGRERFSCN